VLDRPDRADSGTLYTTPRFEGALEKALTDWAVADPVLCADLADCERKGAFVVVPLFGRRYLVSHPSGVIEPIGDGPTMGQAVGAGRRARTVHASIAILLMHYLLTADAAPEADRWAAFRELPGGMFYATAFADHAEAALAGLVASGRSERGLSTFRSNGVQLGGIGLDLADAAMWFQAFPRLRVAAVLWTGDDEFPGQARVLFDANACHYLPTEDLAGMGDWLAHQLVRAG
jgi:hypothetical protein